MSHEVEVLLGLFVVFVAAQAGAEVAQRLKMPGVVGEIAAGCLIGPSVLNWIHVDTGLKLFAEIGAVILLFAVGLETRLDDLKKVGRVAAMVGILGVALPFVLGGIWASTYGLDTPKALFLAIAFVATSAGITARVLQELGVLDRMESRVIMGAAVIDDILAMLLLGVVTAMQGGGGINVWHLLLILLQAIGFVVLIAVAGTQIMRRSSNLLEAPVNPRSPLKLVGCGIGAWSMGGRSALIVGVGMVPRGEVGIIIASLGKQAGIISDGMYAIIIAMSLLTSVVAPPALTALFMRPHR